MSITKAYITILEQEQLDEGAIKNAIVGLAIAGGALGIHQAMKAPVEAPSEVVGAIHHVEKEEPKFMDKQTSIEHIKKKFKVSHDVAEQAVHAAFKHAAPNGQFPQAHHMLALAGVESSFRPNVKSSLKRDKAIGLTQVRPKTSGLKPKALATIDDQFKHSSAILQKMHKTMKNPHDTLTAYNNGVTATLRGGNINRNYAPKVMKELEEFKVR
jgi:Transglycosylase SLT domain